MSWLCTSSFLNARIFFTSLVRDRRCDKHIRIPSSTRSLPSLSVFLPWLSFEDWFKAAKADRTFCPGSTPFRAFSRTSPKAVPWKRPSCNTSWISNPLPRGGTQSPASQSCFLASSKKPCKQSCISDTPRHGSATRARPLNSQNCSLSSPNPKP